MTKILERPTLNLLIHFLNACICGQAEMRSWKLNPGLTLGCELANSLSHRLLPPVCAHLKKAVWKAEEVGL